MSYRACRRSIISLNSVSRCDHQFFPCVECSKIDLQPQQRSTGITSELVTMSKIPPSELPPHSANRPGRRFKELDPNDPSDNAFLMVSLQFIVVNIIFFSKKRGNFCSSALSLIRARGWLCELSTEDFFFVAGTFLMNFSRQITLRWGRTTSLLLPRHGADRL